MKKLPLAPSTSLLWLPVRCGDQLVRQGNRPLQDTGKGVLGLHRKQVKLRPPESPPHVAYPPGSARAAWAAPACSGPPGEGRWCPTSPVPGRLRAASSMGLFSSFFRWSFYKSDFPHPPAPFPQSFKCTLNIKNIKSFFFFNVNVLYAPVPLLLSPSLGP